MTLERGSRGKVVFLSPFDAYNSDKEWTVSGIDSIPHLKSFGIDILELVYKKQGLLDSDYATDIVDDISIVAFTDDAQMLLYVPANRVQLGDEHPIIYREKVLGIALPSLPIDYSLATLIEDLKITVKEKIGYDVNIEEVSVSGNTMVKKSDHDIIINKLNLPTIEKRGYKTKYLQEVLKNIELNTIITDLKGLIVKLKNR